MKDYYLNAIEGKKRGNMPIYKQVIQDFYGDLTWSQVKALPEGSLFEIFFELKNRIKVAESKYDIKKLAYAIQHSRSGAGGCAMTRFHCLFCGKDEMWGNTAVPKICIGCAKDMATNIVMYEMKFEKEEEKR